jgi:hypothetical protein
MIKIEVRYYLTNQGLHWFPAWYEKVYQATSPQEGFIAMSYRMEDTTALVNLDFRDQKTLDQWTETELHDLLAEEIEPYLIRPSDVSITEER